MKCPKCGNNIPDGAKFCSKCGAKTDQFAAPDTQNGRKAGKKKTGTILLITFAVILLLAAVTGGGYIGYQIYQKMSGQPETSDEWGKSVKATEESSVYEESEPVETEAETIADESMSAAHASQAPALPSDSNAVSEIAGTSAAWAGNPAAAPTAPWAVNQTQAGILPAGSDGFILPDSATRYLSSTDIETLTPEQLRIARNEIYARHGRKFKDAGLQTYFNGQSWYIGTIESNQFSDDTMLNDIERKNLEVIKAREAALN